MTLLEVVIAFTVLIIILVPVSELFSTILSQSGAAREKLTALSLAEQWIEKLDNLGPPTKNNQPDVGARITEASKLTRSGVAYTVWAEFTWTASELAHTGNKDLCTSGSQPRVLDLAVTVTWAGTNHVRDTTLVAYPAPDEVKDGFLAISIEGSPSSDPPADTAGKSFATRVEAVPIVITKTTTKGGAKFSTTASATGDGCAFKAVIPGTYTVKVEQPTKVATSWNNDWVANATESTATQSQTHIKVVASVVTTVVFEWDEGALIKVAYPSTTADDGTLHCAKGTRDLCVASGQSYTGSTPAASADAELYVLYKTPTSGTASWLSSTPSVSTKQVTQWSDSACTPSTTTTKRCIVVGTQTVTGTSYGVAASTKDNAAVSWSGARVTGTSSLTGVVCPKTTSTTICYAYGWKSTGAAVIMSTSTLSSTTVTWSATADTVKTPPSSHTLAAFTGFACVTTKACYATALYKPTGSATTTEGEILSLSPGGTSWKTDPVTLSTSSTTVTSFDHLTCAASLTSSNEPICYAAADTTKAVTTRGKTTRTTASTEVSLKSSSATSWVTDTLPSSTSFTVKTITDITCPSTTVCVEVGIATTSSGSTASGMAMHVTSTKSTTWTKYTVTSAISALTTVGCASTTRCFAIATKASGPVMLSLSGTTWSTDTVSVTLAGLDEITCATSDCLAVGTSSGTNPGGVLLKLPSSGTTLTNVALPSTGTVTAVQYLATVACSTASYCGGLGANQSGATMLVGTATATSWSTTTPSGLTGLHQAKTPISVSNADLEENDPLELVAATSSSTDPTQIGPLFPFTNGYSVAAGDCRNEVTSYAGSATSIPGAKTTAPTVTLPMGNLPVQALTKYGQPDAGATVSATVHCTATLAALSGTNPTPMTISLTKTDALGTSETAVMYGDFTVKITLGSFSATVYLAITPTVTEEYTSSFKTASATFPLDTPVVVTLT